MKVVVTGAAGYVGSQTVLALSDAGHEVLAIDHVSLPKAVSAVCAQQLRQTQPWIGFDIINHKL